MDTLTIENKKEVGNPIPTIRYQYSNHLESASLELDANGDIISYEEYYPFGSTSYRAGRPEAEVSLKRYRYVGKERDDESGLYYYGARYYAAWLGRFVSVDPLKDDYIQLSPYQYAGNEPIGDIDIDGLEGTKTQILPIAKSDATGIDPLRDKRLSLQLSQKQQQKRQSDLQQLLSGNGPDPRTRPNATFISADNRSDFQRKEAQKQLKRMEFEQRMQEFRSKADPFVAGRPGTSLGLGFASTTATAIKEIPYIVLPELAVARVSRFAGPITDAVRASKGLQNAKSSVLFGGDALSTGSRTTSRTISTVSSFSEIAISVPEAILVAEEASFVNKFVSNQIPPNFGVFLEQPLSTDALRVLSGELGGVEVAQIFVKSGDSGYFSVLYGSTSRISIPSFGDDVPYLISHVHPSGNPLASQSDILLLEKFQQIQKAAGQPVQTSSQIIPIGSPNNSFNLNSPTHGF